MAAFLALPIAEYPKSNSNFELSYAVKYTGMQPTFTPAPSSSSLLMFQVITTAAMAVPFVILALYVNPLLRLFKVFMRGLRKFSRRLSHIGLYILVMVSICGTAFFKAIWFICKNLSCFFITAKLFGKLVYVLLVNWKRLLRWFREYRQAKNTSKDEGTEWRKRRFVIDKLIAWKKRQKRAENEEDPERYSSSGSSLSR